MDVFCPACHSKDTQKIATPDTPEPKLKTDGNPVVGALILSAIGGWIPALVLYVSTGKLVAALFLFVVTVFLIYVLIKRNIMKNRHYNENEYPRERAVWENGFYCYDCGTIFVPTDGNQPAAARVIHTP